MGEITLGSLFDGIGGFPYAASFYGIRALWASEVLADCISVTKRHFPDMRHMGDITKLHGGRLPPVDIITFGSPCQGLSIAGLRKGLADERSGLFTEAVRIIDEMKEATHGEYPKFALWENVPGALSSAGGRDFKAVLGAFTKSEIPMPYSGRWANAGMVRSGGTDIAWCVYDSQYFGTAQRRRRVFLVADLGGRRAGKVLFVPESLRGYFAAGGTPRQGASAFAEDGAGETGVCVNAGEERKGDDGVYSIIGNIIGRKHHNGSRGLGCTKELSYTLTAGDRHAVTAPGVMCMGSDHAKAGIGREQSPTLTAHGAAPILTDKAPGYRVRRLTPLECERLQGFPDHWTGQGDDGRMISDTKRYQMLGNSIAVPCAAYIMQGMCGVLAKDK